MAYLISAGQVMIIALRILQKLVVSAELVGQALVPYYRQVREIWQMLRMEAVSNFPVISIDCNFDKRSGELTLGHNCRLHLQVLQVSEQFCICWHMLQLRCHNQASIFLLCLVCEKDC